MENTYNPLYLFPEYINGEWVDKGTGKPLVNNRITDLHISDKDEEKFNITFFYAKNGDHGYLWLLRGNKNIPSKLTKMLRITVKW